MPTERLYYDDAYLTEFDAEVAAVREGGWAALDRSAFYPTSGGQPFDTGTLTVGERVLHVTDVEVEDGVVWHKLSGPVSAGERAHGKIDWARRFDHMQQHAADHMLAGAAWQLYGGVTIGLHLGRENSTIDMTLPDGRTHLTPEEIETLEDTVNRRVQQDNPIRCWFPSAEELETLPVRKRPTVSEHVRIVAMGDYEMVPCGGTHPGTTGQIGPIKIISCTPSRGNMRLCFAAGMRAVKLFRQAYQCAGDMAAAVSADFDGAPDALKREREAALAQRKELKDRLTLAALDVLRAKKQGSVYAAHLPFADHDTLLKAASELTRDPEAIVLLSCPKGEGRMLVFARGASASPDMARLLRSTGARGGGKPDMAQGSDSDGEAIQKAVQALGE
ncbi:MAG: hypothetical protein IKH30_04720 [Clostridia bacterium]|nr:hypothetical protein [Clostridia bacterium]